MKNQIKVIRTIDGFIFEAIANYVPHEDHWNCQVREICGGRYNKPDDVRYGVIDAWLELHDMIDLAIDTARSRERFNAGPFSQAQCR
jgi:hypothetical protein